MVLASNSNYNNILSRFYLNIISKPAVGSFMFVRVNKFKIGTEPSASTKNGDFMTPVTTKISLLYNRLKSFYNKKNYYYYRFFNLFIYSSHSVGSIYFFLLLHSLQAGTIFIFSDKPPLESGIL